MNVLTVTCLALLTPVAFMPFSAPGQTQTPKTGIPSPAVTNTTEGKWPSTKEFRFDGGSFRDFTRKLAQHFGTNFLDVLDVRSEEAYLLRIPKMRQTSFTGDWNSEWNRVLKLYNQISEEGNGFLGKWLFTPENPGWIVGGQPPQTLVFLPPPPAAREESALQVRAFPVLRLARERRKELIEIIEQESQRMQAQDLSLAQGRLSLHEGSGLLIASGGRAYVELVKTVVDAFMVNYPPVALPRP